MLLGGVGGHIGRDGQRAPETRRFCGGRRHVNEELLAARTTNQSGHCMSCQGMARQAEEAQEEGGEGGGGKTGGELDEAPIPHPTMEADEGGTEQR
jgi:hypothetical protein